MKILKIFGLVVGVHVLAFMFVFAIPGCRSTTRHSPPPPEAVQADAVPVRAAPPTPDTDGSAPLGSPIAAGAPADQAASPAPSGTAAPALSFATDASGSPVVRFNPTRPGTTEANLLEPVAEPTSTPAITYTVLSGDSLWKIAKKHGVSTKEILAANHLRSNAPLREGQKLLIPGKAISRSSAGAVQPSENSADTLTYRVKSGETLGAIARRSGTTSATIRSLNHLRSDNLHAGQELILPAGGSAASTLAAAPEEATSSGRSRNSGGLHHVVKPGETLGSIAKHYGVSRRELAVANNIADPLKLRAGQDLSIPGKSGVSGKSSAPAASDATETPSAHTPSSEPASTGESPIAPAPITDGNPVAAPTQAEPTPPVIQVQDSSSPVSSPK